MSDEWITVSMASKLTGIAKNTLTAAAMRRNSKLVRQPDAQQIGLTGRRLLVLSKASVLEYAKTWHKSFSHYGVDKFRLMKSLERVMNAAMEADIPEIARWFAGRYHAKNGG